MVIDVLAAEVLLDAPIVKWQHEDELPARAQFAADFAQGLHRAWHMLEAVIGDRHVEVMSLHLIKSPVHADAILPTESVCRLVELYPHPLGAIKLAQDPTSATPEIEHAVRRPDVRRELARLKHRTGGRLLLIGEILRALVVLVSI